MRNVLAHGPRLMLAVDPGGETGWLLFRPVVDTAVLGGVGIVPVAWGEERDQIRFCDQVWRWKTARLASERIDGIVIENWKPRGGAQTWEPEAIEIIGFCRWVMDGDPHRFFVQEVHQATSFSTETKIRPYRAERVPPLNVGRGGNGHAVKALQHAVLWTHTRWSPEEAP